MNTNKGFTLIELLVAVTIVGLLAAIAYPSYREQVRTSRRTDCAGALTSLSGEMEQFYTTNSSYLGAAAGGANTGAPAVFAATCPVDGGDATYNLTIQAATATTYTIQAAPIGVQAADKCGTLTLNNLGIKGVNGADAGLTWQDCWR